MQFIDGRMCEGGLDMVDICPSELSPSRILDAARQAASRMVARYQSSTIRSRDLVRTLFARMYGLDGEEAVFQQASNCSPYQVNMDLVKATN